MEKKIFASYDEALETLVKAGISDSRLEKAVESHNLPESGEFVGFEIRNEGEPSAHAVVICNDGSVCSLGRVRGQAAFVGKLTDTTFTKGKKPETADGLFLKTSVLNAQLPANQARLAMELQGRKFRTEKVSGFSQSGFDGGKLVLAKDIASARAQCNLRTFWKITLE